LPPHRFINAGVIHGANMAFRRRVIELIGPFDVYLGAGAPLLAGEDVDYIQRASAAGFTGAYTPDVCVSHHHRRRYEHLADLIRGYDIARGALYAKLLWSHPGIIFTHVREQIRCNPTFVAYCRYLYWTLRSRLLQRAMRICYGGLKYAAIRAYFGVARLFGRLLQATTQ
jgi:GT2 family glycosyltransferase